MSDTPITVAPAIQRLALALAALEAGRTVQKVQYAGAHRYRTAGAEYWEVYETPIDALASVSATPHPVIMSLVTALQQARERLTALDLKPLDANALLADPPTPSLGQFVIDNQEVLAVIDAALKGE